MWDSSVEKEIVFIAPHSDALCPETQFYTIVQTLEQIIQIVCMGLIIKSMCIKRMGKLGFLVLFILFLYIQHKTGLSLIFHF